MRHLQVYLFFGIPITIAICVYICFLGNISYILLAGAGLFLLNLIGKRLKSSTVTTVRSSVEKVKLENELVKANMIKDYTEVLGDTLEWSTKQQLQAAREHLAIQKAVWDQELLTRKQTLNASVEEKIEMTRRKESEWTNHQIEKAEYDLAQLQRKQRKELDEKRASGNKLLAKRKIDFEEKRANCEAEVNIMEQSARNFRRGSTRAERLKI